MKSFSSNNKVLIIGGQGYVGSQLQGDLRVGTKQVDLRNREATYNFLKRNSPETVIHSAPGGIFSAQKNINRSEYLSNEMRIHLNVLESCFKIGVKKLVAISSVSAFPADIQCPSEEDLFKSEPHPAVFHYAHAKRFLDVLLQSYTHEHRLDYISLLLSNVYGPGPNYENHPSLIPHLIRTCRQAISAHSDWEISGDPNAIRDYIYSEDLGSIVKNVIELTSPPKRLIVGSGETKSVQQAVETIANLLNFKGKIVWKATAIGGQNKKICDNSQLLNVFPKIQLTSFEDGLRQTLLWYKTQKKAS